MKGLENHEQFKAKNTTSYRYEMYPDLSQSWYEKGVGIASNEGAGIGDDGEPDWQHIRNIRTDLLGFTYTLVDELYDGSHGGEDAVGNPTSTDVFRSRTDAWCMF